MPETHGDSDNTTHVTLSHRRRSDTRQEPSSQSSECSDPYQRLQRLYDRFDASNASGEQSLRNFKPATLHCGANNTLTEILAYCPNSGLSRDVKPEFEPSVPALYDELSGSIVFEGNIFEHEQPSLIVESIKNQRWQQKIYKTGSNVPTPDGTVRTTFVIGEITEDIPSRRSATRVKFVTRHIKGNLGLISPPSVKVAARKDNEGD